MTHDDDLVLTGKQAQVMKDQMHALGMLRGLAHALQGVSTLGFDIARQHRDLIPEVLVFSQHIFAAIDSIESMMSVAKAQLSNMLGVDLESGERL